MVYCHKFAYIEHLITLKLWSIHRELSRWLSDRGWFLLLYLSISRQRQSQGEQSHTAIGLRTAGQEYDLGLFLQSNKPASGEARQSGNSAIATEVVLSSR